MSIRKYASEDWVKEQLQGFESGVTSWNDLEDKPFGDETTYIGDTLTWDGDPTGKYFIEPQDSQFVCLISDSVPTMDQIPDSRSWTTVSYLNNEKRLVTVEVSKYDLITNDDGFITDGAVFIIPYNNYIHDGFTFEYSGVYFSGMPEGYVKSLTIPGYNFKHSTLKTIDPKYLPEMNFDMSEAVDEAKAYTDTEVSKKPGLKTTGTEYTINGVSVTAGDGAEIFNDYTNNIASGNYSHAEGSSNKATNFTAHAEGWGNEATGMYSHAEGYSNQSTGNSAHAEGYDTIASADYSHSEGAYTKATGYSSHAEGNTTEASASYTHAEGSYTKATSSNAHAEGNSTEASGDYSHAEGYSTKATQSSAHAEGYSTEATGQYSHAEGYDAVASSYQAHAEGYSTKATNTSAHAEGHYTEASGSYSHAEGYYSKATKSSTHAEGYYSEANGEYSHAEGERTVTTGWGSHTEGKETKASGEYSHAEGAYTKAAGQHQHVQGRYNIEDTTNTYAHIVGNGQWSSDDSKRSNAHTLDWDGNAWYQGTVEATALILSSPNGTRFQITVGDDGVLSATEITIE